MMDLTEVKWATTNGLSTGAVTFHLKIGRTWTVILLKSRAGDRLISTPKALRVWDAKGVEGVGKGEGVLPSPAD